MRGLVIVEAVVALSIGVGGGFGFLYGTGALKGSSEIAALKASVDQELRRREEVKQERQRREQMESAAKAAAEAATRAAAEVAAKLKAEQDAANAARAAANAAANSGPKFGMFIIKALSGDLVVDGGPDLKGSGKEVQLAFNDEPGKIKIKAGKFNVVLTPSIVGKTLRLDASVSPLAIIKGDGVAMGTSASGIEVGKSGFTLEFASPASGELKLLLQFKK